jgi:hypothetical protein
MKGEPTKQQIEALRVWLAEWLPQAGENFDELVHWLRVAHGERRRRGRPPLMRPDLMRDARALWLAEMVRTDERLQARPLTVRQVLRVLLTVDRDNRLDLKRNAIQPRSAIDRAVGRKLPVSWTAHPPFERAELLGALQLRPIYEAAVKLLEK